MKRVTQKKLLEYVYQLPPISEYQKSYAMRHLPVVCFKYRKQLYNGDTGQVIDNIPKNCEDNTKIVAHLGMHSVIYKYTIITVFKGIQVLRTFWVTKHCEIHKPVRYQFDEVYQNWYVNGKRIITGKRRKSVMYTYDCFDVNSDYNIRKEGYGYYGYSFTGCYIALISKLTFEFARKGFSLVNHVPDLRLEELFEYVPNDNRLETLLKIRYLRKNTFDLSIYNECLVANRHHYKPKDWQMWKDYIGNLKELGLDTHNPQYLCPKNLVEAHDRMLRRIQRKHRKEELEEAMKHGRDFIERIAKFANLVIDNGEIKIVPLMSIKEFAEESEIMHHCVFDNRYYNKENSLILSAQVAEKHVETIEYDILNNKVIQSRGLCNQTTKYHNTILQMMSRLHIYKNKSFKIKAS